MVAFAALTAVPASADSTAADSYRQSVQDAYDLVKGSAPSDAATFEDGLLSLAVIDAAHRSSEGGGWEPVQV